MKNKRFMDLLDDLTDNHCKCQYCFLKKFLESLHPKTSVLIQLKCLEKFKWERSQKENREIDWNEAAFIWADEGYAKAFREVFNEDLSINEIYKQTITKIIN